MSGHEPLRATSIREPSICEPASTEQRRAATSRHEPPRAATSNHEPATSKRERERGPQSPAGLGQGLMHDGMREGEKVGRGSQRLARCCSSACRFGMGSASQRSFVTALSAYLIFAVRSACNIYLTARPRGTPRLHVQGGSRQARRLRLPIPTPPRAGAAGGKILRTRQLRSVPPLKEKPKRTFFETPASKAGVQSPPR